MPKKHFDAATLDARDRSKLLSGLVVPRPIGWIGSRGPDGDNLAPFSFFNLVVTNPPIVLFCPGRSRRDKDTLVNVAAGGCFTVSLVTDDLIEVMNLTSGEYSGEVNEFELAGLEAVEGSTVAAPMVGQAKANLECRVTDIHDIGDPPAASVVLGEVVGIHVDEDLLDGTRIRFDRLGAVGRLAGPWYSLMSDLYELERPDSA